MHRKWIILVVLISLIVVGIVGNKLKSEYSYIFQLGSEKDKPLCENSGGKWSEKKGKDLPMMKCICEYNNWLSRHQEDIVERGCNCNLSCFGTKEQFNYFDEESYYKTHAPTTTNKKIIRDELSTCHFLPNKDNVCSQCNTDEECKKGVGNSGGSYYYKYTQSSVCVNHVCRIRRIIYFGSD